MQRRNTTRRLDRDAFRSPKRCGRLKIGSRFTIIWEGEKTPETYVIVQTAEVDATQYNISLDSLLAKAVDDAADGEEISYEVNDSRTLETEINRFSFRLLSIE